MKQTELEWISEIIRKHQKQMRSRLSSMRQDKRSLESFKLSGDAEMVKFMESEIAKDFSAFKAQREIVRELAEFADIGITEGFGDIFLPHEIKSKWIGKVRGQKILEIGDVAHRPHIREILARVA